MIMQVIVKAIKRYRTVRKGVGLEAAMNETMSSYLHLYLITCS
jgi:hypothetical protein